MSRKEGENAKHKGLPIMARQIFPTNKRGRGGSAAKLTADTESLPALRRDPIGSLERPAAAFAEPETPQTTDPGGHKVTEQKSGKIEGHQPCTQRATSSPNITPLLPTATPTLRASTTVSRGGSCLLPSRLGRPARCRWSWRRGAWRAWWFAPW